jgi:cytochrome b
MPRSRARAIPSNGLRPIGVWDVPVRITHWATVLLVTFSWTSAEMRWMTLHRISGYLVLAAVSFRILWGFCGSPHARFRNFLRGPRAVIHYFRTLRSKDGACPTAGHNPAGGWSVAILLFLLLLQGLVGLLVVDVDGLESGPLASWLSFDIGRRMAELHEVAFNILLTFILLHVAAVLFYLIWRRENLIAPMFTGIKRVRRDG